MGVLLDMSRARTSLQCDVGVEVVAAIDEAEIVGAGGCRRQVDDALAVGNHRLKDAFAFGIEKL